MSFDLFVCAVEHVDIAGLEVALSDQKCRINGEIAGSLDDHSGGFPFIVSWKKVDYEECPELHFHTEFEWDDDMPPKRRKEAQTATQVFSISGGYDPSTFGLAAAIATAGKGFVFDPQTGDHFTPSQAWKEFKILCADAYVSVTLTEAMSAEEKYVAKLKARSPFLSVRQIEREVEWWREQEWEKRCKKVLDPAIEGDLQNLSDFLEKPISEADAKYLLLAAGRLRNPDKAGLILKSLEAELLFSLANDFFYSRGIASRVFVELLFEAGLAEHLPVDRHSQLVARCTDKDIRNVVTKELNLSGAEQALGK